MPLSGAGYDLSSHTGLGAISNRLAQSTDSDRIMGQGRMSGARSRDVAGRRFVAHSGNVLDLHCLEVLSAVENQCDQTIPERLGFRHDAAVRPQRRSRRLCRYGARSTGSPKQGRTVLRGGNDGSAVIGFNFTAECTEKLAA